MKAFQRRRGAPWPFDVRRTAAAAEASCQVEKCREIRGRTAALIALLAGYTCRQLTSCVHCIRPLRRRDVAIHHLHKGEDCCCCRCCCHRTQSKAPSVQSLPRRSSFNMKNDIDDARPSVRVSLDTNHASPLLRLTLSLLARRLYLFFLFLRLLLLLPTLPGNQQSANAGTTLMMTMMQQQQQQQQQQHSNRIGGHRR